MTSKVKSTSSASIVPDAKENSATLTGKSVVPEFYVDGVTQMLLGYPMTKIMFHSIYEPGRPDRPEARRAAVHLSMTTASAIELANLILGICKESEEHLDAVMQQDGPEKIKQLISKINVEIPKGYETK